MREWVPVRLSAPVLFRLKWVAGPRAGVRARTHARYIAMREGVARGAESPDPLIHARYLGERPGSTGLFGADPARPPDLTAVQAAVRDRPWHWQAVLSLREEDARALGVATPADWRDLARRIMPQYAATLGVHLDELRWVAAMHHKAGHPHVHVLAWLREGAAERPPGLSRQELRAVRRVVARETYGPMRTQAGARKTAERDHLIAAGKINLQALRRAELQARVERPQGARLPPRFAAADLRDLAGRIEALAPGMPGHGQARLAYMPPETKAEARAIADWILARPALAGSLASMEAAVRDLTALYRQGAAAGDEAWSNARSDVRDRMAQVVVRAAAGSSRDRAASPHARRAPARRGAWGLLASVHGTLERERLRAEARAGLGRTTEASRAEAHAASERAAQLGVEHK